MAAVSTTQATAERARGPNRAREERVESEPSSTEPKALREGRYVLYAALGHGSQGTTWDAVDKREGRAVAVKAFDVRGAKAWKDVELAEREARVLSELSHPLLPRYIEHFEEDGVLYLVMEKVHGTPLSILKQKGPPLTDKELTRLLHDADQALTYLHGRKPPVIHRDLKPSNVIRRTDGSFAFVDFGAVRDRLRPEGGSTVVGTFGYMAPEQFQGRAGPASDVYAIGATAMAMATGEEPEKLPHRGLSLDVEAALKGRLSPELRHALTRMLEPDPDKRATRIGPLLDARRPSAAPPGSKSRRRESWADHDAVDVARESVRQARRAAKRAVREGRRNARRQWRGHHPFRLPFPLRLLFGVGLTIAQIGVTLALQVVVPTVLTVLSLVFGSGLRRAANDVRGAGSDADEALREAATRVHRGWGDDDDIRVRVSAPPRGEPSDGAGRVRVEEPLDDEDDDGEEAADEAERRRRRV
jgi:Protein kinase domain